MVEYDIQHHGKPERVSGIDESMKIIRCAIRRVRGIQQYAVIPPTAPPPELGHGHHFQLRYTQIGEIRQFVDGRPEGAFLREGADMQLVDHRLFPRTSLPFPLCGQAATRVDHHRRAIDVSLLRARGRVRHRHSIL